MEEQLGQARYEVDQLKEQIRDELEPEISDLNDDLIEERRKNTDLTTKINSELEPKVRELTSFQNEVLGFGLTLPQLRQTIGIVRDSGYDIRQLCLELNDADREKYSICQTRDDPE